ncbi:ac11 [Choristoneura murinana nucleopolyhedrovirus]|uniref:Ac11 n=1 Tax=Choristoneura murinana nucleopolyhedrovirus TaxID=1987479 RepID=V9XTY7_9ABAC|nr:ac11 [Choristoneura murinana nucleopolyhedrovirus]AHD25626.1 ac11 [Choristoneura murinana nucleopolyhedrovirus]
MSLSSKLLVYAYYGAYNLPHEKYGESYHLYRIVHEHLTEAYKVDASCVRRDIATARCLNSGDLCFDLARQLLDVGEVAARLAAWYSCGDATGLCADVQRALVDIDRYAPVEKRAIKGCNIFALDAIADIPGDVLDGLQGIIGRFIYFVRCNELERVADVFDPQIKAKGWWYHKFCVLTYMHRITTNAVPAKLITRLRDAVTKFIQPEHKGNCAPAMADMYGRFCGISREHFSHHKTASMHLLFQYMRNDVTWADESHPSFRVIKDFGRCCKETYTDLRAEADALYITATTDEKKNALFDLLCCVNAADLDADCYDYIVNKFYNFKSLNKTIDV